MKLPPSDNEFDGPNLTPVIDIVFLLLIFFLVATQFNNDVFEIDTHRPKVVKARPVVSGVKQIVVNIDDKGSYRVEGETFTAPELQAFLHEEQVKNPDMQTVLINADERVTFRYPARVMGICESEKIRHSCAVEQVGAE